MLGKHKVIEILDEIEKHVDDDKQRMQNTIDRMNDYLTRMADLLGIKGEYNLPEKILDKVTQYLVKFIGLETELRELRNPLNKISNLPKDIKITITTNPMISSCPLRKNFNF